MKWNVGFVLLMVMTLKNETRSEEQLQVTETIFTRNFRRLHQGVPISNPAVGKRDNVRTLWIDQRLDNFKESDTRSWKMRYISNDEFYQEDGPFFIFVGGEMPILPGYVTGGHLYSMAKEHNGYLFCTEHRYYGESKPTSNMDNDNIRYLHVRQALADLAHFIEEMRATVPGASKAKVILAGGSYPGSMVIWFKKLYPDLVTGCWSSSAPLLAKVNLVEYKEVTGQSINFLGGEQCYKRIENGIAEMEALFANKRGAEVKALLKLCDDFDENNDLDLWTLFNEIAEVFAWVVMLHSNDDIQCACTKIMEGDNDITSLASYLLTKFGSASCNKISYKEFLNDLSNSTYSNNMMRQWTYQTCNEFGWYQTSESMKQPFGTKFPLEFFIQICQDVFGKRFTSEFIHQQVSATNNLFGGLEPHVENVYFTHGQLDPWRTMGIQDDAQATVIPLYAHCKDFGVISSNDTTEMRASKLKLAGFVRQWLAG